MLDKVLCCLNLAEDVDDTNQSNLRIGTKLMLSLIAGIAGVVGIVGYVVFPFIKINGTVYNVHSIHMDIFQKPGKIELICIMSVIFVVMLLSEILADMCKNAWRYFFEITGFLGSICFLADVMILFAFMRSSTINGVVLDTYFSSGFGVLVIFICIIGVLNINKAVRINRGIVKLLCEKENSVDEHIAKAFISVGEMIAVMIIVRQVLSGLVDVMVKCSL